MKSIFILILLCILFVEPAFATTILKPEEQLAQAITALNALLPRAISFFVGSMTGLSFVYAFSTRWK